MNMHKCLILMIYVAAACTAEKTNPKRQERVAAAPAAGDATETVKPDVTPPTGEPPAPPKGEPAKPPISQGPEAGNLNVQWFAGAANCNQDNNPALQVHAYNKNLTILRQNKCLNFEAPFIYLIFGAQKALLIDTGATASAATFPLATTVENLLVEHYGAVQRAQIMLIVAHSHAHGDHRAADAQFTGRANTTVVGTSQAAVMAFFGITDWPNSVTNYDLGGRIIQAIPIPGHEPSSLAFYDAQTGILFTGDSLYPGRLYIQDWEVYRASIARLQTFASGKTITHVLGSHVEISKTPGQDYPAGSTFQPDEHVLQLKKEALSLLDAELKNIGSTPMRKVLDEFIISP
jgi:glyoxylase-like metal-dependent hydrolase (beta-lactamase superfamily II)